MRTPLVRPHDAARGTSVEPSRAQRRADMTHALRRTSSAPQRRAVIRRAPASVHTLELHRWSCALRTPLVPLHRGNPTEPRASEQRGVGPNAALARIYSAGGVVPSAHQLVRLHRGNPTEPRAPEQQRRATPTPRSPGAKKSPRRAAPRARVGSSVASLRFKLREPVRA